MLANGCCDSNLDSFGAEMSEMIERVARGIYEAFRRERIISGASKWVGPWENIDQDGRAYFSMLAEAAIEAMREPTKEMALEGIRLWQTSGAPPGTDFNTRELYQAMINEALK